MDHPRMIGWRSRVHAMTSPILHAPLAWGSNDCIRLVRMASLAITGHDPAQAVQITKLPPYTTAKEAVRALQEMGYSDLPALLDDIFHRKPHTHTLLGDLAITNDQRLAAGITCNGKAYFIGDGAPTYRSLDNNITAWDTTKWRS